MNSAQFTCEQTGCQPLCEIEDSLIDLVFKNIGDLPNEFPGEIPNSVWSDRDERRVERIWRRPEKTEVLAGIVAYLVELLVEKYSNQTGKHEGVFAVKDGKLSEIGMSDVLHICDPAIPPVEAQSVLDAAGWVQFGRNRRFERTFLETRHWVIRSEPNWSFATCREDEDEIRMLWEKLKKFSNCKLVIRSTKRDRNNHGFKTASEIARELNTDKDLLLQNAKLPRIGTPQYDKLKKHVLLRGAVLTDEERKRVTEKDIRRWVGNPVGVRNRAIDALLKDFRAKFPKR